MRNKKVDEGVLINRLIGKIESGCDVFHGYEEERKILSNVITKTIRSGDSGSVIIFGPRGSGKSCLLEDMLVELKVNESSRRHYIIRLDGLIHNTDTLALSVIAEALGIEINNTSQIGAGLQSKISLSKSRIPFLFILNEIDVFCRRQQTLLYTLFDTIHNVNGLCLIGLTAKHDCTDYLEKRVRSRILYQSIVLTSPFKSEKDYFDYVANYLENSINPDLLKPLVHRQYAKSTKPGDMKTFLLDFLYNYDHLKSNTKFLIKDAKINRLESLTPFELAVICLVLKRLNQTQEKLFRPIEIIPLLPDIPSQIASSKETFIYALNQLIDYGLVTINSNQRSHSYISDWSSLSLNVVMAEIQIVLRSKKNLLPTGFTKLLEA